MPSEMLNDAARLAAVMRDVPDGVWPSSLRYDWNQNGPKRAKHWHVIDVRIDPNTAELACIGSMTAWLASKGLALVPPCYASSNPTTSHWWLAYRGGHPQYDKHRSSFDCSFTLTEALAAACKAIKENGDADA